MNKYDIIEVIDEGAYGIVLKALNRETNGYVAIKKFKEADEDSAVHRGIQREIKMLKLLRSQYVIDLKEAFRRKGKVYLIFEYMERNLLNLLEQYETGLPSEMIVTIMYQMFKGLAELHHRDVVHRDVKPQNLLLNSDLKLKLCDFGFTRVLHPTDAALTDYVATRWYRSPQLLVGGEYGKPIDVWAAGCIMGELIDGQPLFPGENEIDQLYLIRKTIGQLTATQNDVLWKNPRFAGLKFPEMSEKDPLQYKYIGKMSKQAMSFLKACLTLDPNARITAAEALKHPYFAALAAKQSYVELTPHTSNQQSQRQDAKYKPKQLDLEIPRQTPSVQKQIKIGVKTIYGGGLKSVTQASTQLLRQLRRKGEQSISPHSKLHRYQHHINDVIREELQGDSVSRKIAVFGQGKKEGRRPIEPSANLPRLKQAPTKIMQFKAVSQPLMLNNVPKTSQPNSIFNLSVLGRTKSIMKMKKF